MMLKALSSLRLKARQNAVENRTGIALQNVAGLSDRWVCERQIRIGGGQLMGWPCCVTGMTVTVPVVSAPLILRLVPETVVFVRVQRPAEASYMKVLRQCWESHIVHLRNAELRTGAAPAACQKRPASLQLRR